MQTNRAVWDHFGLQMVELWAQEFPQLSGEEYTQHRKNPAYGGFKLNSYLYHKGLDGSDGAGTKLYTQHREQVVAIMANLAFPAVEEAIQLIHDAAGTLSCRVVTCVMQRLPLRVVDQLVATGLDGLEGYSPSLSPEMAALLREYAEEHQLLLTAAAMGTEVGPVRRNMASGLSILMRENSTWEVSRNILVMRIEGDHVTYRFGSTKGPGPTPCEANGRGPSSMRMTQAGPLVLSAANAHTPHTRSTR